MIPSWRQHVFEGSEHECIKFFVNTEFEGDLVGWIDQAILDNGDEAVMQEIKTRWRDFGDFDFPYGYTRVNGKLSDLWKKGNIMWGMDEYVRRLE